ncbi:MAG: hypothetical protein KA777_04555 [Rhodoferax sp.]|nr:hypothetical protein [Rhodoferax sp.]
MATRTGLIGVALAGVTALAGLTGCATRYAGPISDHFNGREFSNAEPPPAGAF